MTSTTPWTPTTLAAVRARIREVFPACPEGLAERFTALLARPRDDLIARATLVLDKPYGRNHLLDAEAEHGISFAVLLPGRTTSLHWHARRRELFCVRAGRLDVTIGDERRPLATGELAGSTPGIQHALANAGAGDAEVLELFSPYLLDDKTRVSDPYGRRIGAVTVEQ
jgi:mannose-6-phosphate isomerase-like protein (cupin superfamily)